ncbi:MAG: glycosyltransferase family 2 protein [Desulfomonilia bacterium]|jgi:glycosyltransferase involved in cell wall biosynthesis|nr:glycosyltransferase family 2 protein [Desulfomonilia bacterium]
MKPQPKVTIIVCTFNRAEILPYCLDSLVDQTALQDQYEVIVVNNNSSDTTQDIVDRYTSGYRNIRMILEQRQGLSHARNKGWKEANADWVAYIDDDAKAPPGYVERLLHITKTYPFDCFGGVYIPWYKYQKPRWFKDEYASNITVQDHTKALASGYVSGGNFAVKKALLEKFNGFQSDLGMRPGKIAYGEETLLQVKIRDAGYTIGFDPLLVVEHLVSKEKLSPWWQIRSAYARSRDYNMCLPVSFSYRRLLHTCNSILHDLPHHVRKSTPHLFTDDYCWENWVIDVFRPIASHLGNIACMLISRTHKNKS